MEGSIKDQIKQLEIKKYWNDKTLHEKSRGCSIVDINLYKQQTKKDKQNQLTMDILTVAVFFTLWFLAMCMGLAIGVQYGVML